MDTHQQPTPYSRSTEPRSDPADSGDPEELIEVVVGQPPATKTILVRKTTLLDIELIKVVVGPPPATKTILVRKTALLEIPYFRAALSGNWKDGRDGTISLPEDDPDSFDHMIATYLSGEYHPDEPPASPTQGMLSDTPPVKFALPRHRDECTCSQCYIPHIKNGDEELGSRRRPSDTSPQERLGHIEEHDMPRWLQALESSIDVYICANKYLMPEVKDKVSRHIVDLFEAAGFDAGRMETLDLCNKLYEGVGGLELGDRLMRMVLVRVSSFGRIMRKLQRDVWNGFMGENREFFADMVAARQMSERRPGTGCSRELPSMADSLYRITSPRTNTDSVLDGRGNDPKKEEERAHKEYYEQLNLKIAARKSRDAGRG